MVGPSEFPSGKTAKTPRHYCGYVQASCLRALADVLYALCHSARSHLHPGHELDTGLHALRHDCACGTALPRRHSGKPASLLSAACAIWSNCARMARFVACEAKVHQLRKRRCQRVFTQCQAAQPLQTTSQSQSPPDVPKDPSPQIPGPCASRRRRVSARLASGSARQRPKARARARCQFSGNLQVLIMELARMGIGLLASFDFDAVCLQNAHKLLATCHTMDTVYTYTLKQCSTTPCSQKAPQLPRRPRRGPA